MRICILGDTGLLGSAFIRYLSHDHPVLGISTSRVLPGIHSLNYEHVFLDISQEEKRLGDTLSRFRPELIINCAALADIQRCENEPELAMQLNAFLPQKIAGLAKDLDSDFMHISTDAIFNNPTNRPHTTTEIPMPCNVYGRTKLDGERRVLEKTPESLVVRTNIVGFRDKINQPTFGEWLCHALYEKQDILLADDFIASSIHVDLLVPLLFHAYNQGARGLFHFASTDPVSKYEFGLRLARKLNVDFTHVRKGLLTDLHLTPPRSAYIALDVTKTECFLGEKLPDSNVTISRLAEDFKQRIGLDCAKSQCAQKSRGE